MKQQEIETDNCKLGKQNELPDEIHVIAAQLAGVSSILQALRLQIDAGIETTGDSLFALQMMVDNLNINLCFIADSVQILA